MFLHILVQHLLPIFLHFHHYSAPGVWTCNIFMFDLLVFSFHRFYWSHLFLISLSLLCRSPSSRRTGQIWIGLMYLNRHAQWEKALLLTAACSQRADIGVSFCEWDLARAFKWDSWPSLPASSLFSSHTRTHSYLLCGDKPSQSLLDWFRCGGSLVTDAKVRIKHLPCHHLFMVEWKLLAFHTLFTRRCTLYLTHRTMHTTAASCVDEHTASRSKQLKGFYTGFL